MPKRASQRAQACERLGIELAVARHALGEGRRDGVELARRGGAVDVRSIDERLDGRLRVVDRLLVAAAQRADRGARTSGAVVVAASRGVTHEHELGVGRRAVVVDAELVHAGALGLQRDALDVPERRRRRRRLRASSAVTASKPIVTLRTLAGSPPSPRTIELRTASSEGRPVTPARLPSRSRGRVICGWARTAASGRCTSAITPTMSRPFSRARAEVVDVEDRELRAPARAGA